MDISRGTLARNRELVTRLARLDPAKRKEQFFEILGLLEIKVAAHCPEAEQEVRDFGEIVTAFRAAEYQGYR